MLQIRQSTQFKKDIKRSKKRRLDLEKLKKIIEKLVEGKPLPIKNKDHFLTGDWNGYRECHIEPDWLLIYKTSAKELLLARTGTHSDLFKK